MSNEENKSSLNQTVFWSCLILARKHKLHLKSAVLTKQPNLMHTSKRKLRDHRRKGSKVPSKPQRRQSFDQTLSKPDCQSLFTDWSEEPKLFINHRWGKSYNHKLLHSKQTLLCTTKLKRLQTLDEYHHRTVSLEQFFKTIFHQSVLKCC